MTSFESEASIEEKLIRQLTEGKSQWTFRDDIRSFDDLWDNFRRILVQNNKEIFDAHPLTDNEFCRYRTNFGSRLFMMLPSGSSVRTASSGS